MQNRLLLLLLLTVASLPAVALSPPPPPQRLIQTVGSDTPVVLRSVRVNAEISGGMAETTIEMVFYNPNRRQLEGTLQFPLQEGQQITAFALDIDGTLRPAVPVEKAKGRQVFEAIERRQVDPGLLEKTIGNNFQLRIYPIMGQGTRTVQLKYAEPLTRQGAQWGYRLPLMYADKLQNFDLNLSVRGSAVTPIVSGALSDIRFERKDGRFEAAVSRNGFTPNGILNVALPATREPQTYTQVWDGDTYFVTEIPVSGKRVARTLPNVVGLLWDSSGSGADRALEAELAVLDRYFRAMRNGEVRLTRLRDRSEATEVYRVVDGNWSALQSALRATRHDGATNLGDWQPQSDVGEYLLVSDGLNTYGSARFPDLAPRQRLYALNSALSADTDRLSALAERSGGRLIQVAQQRQDAAAQSLLTEGVHIESLTASGATDLQIETRDPESGLIRIAGRLLNTPAELRLSLSNRPALIVPITARAPAHPFAAHLWASYRLRALDVDHELKSAEIRRLGQRFRIPTRETSLIVLELIEDYVRYEIEPPPAQRAAVEQMRAQRGAQLKQRRDSQLERIVREFNQKAAWWDKAWPKDQKPVMPPNAGSISIDRRATSITTSDDVMSTPASQFDGRQNSGAARFGSGSTNVTIGGVVQSNVLRKPAPVAPPPLEAPTRSTSTSGIKAFAAEDIAAASTTKRKAPSSESFREVAQAAVPQSGVALKKWTADAPYIARMQAATADTIYAVYLDEKPSYLNSSAFFLDAAEMLFEKKQRDLALRVLSNLAEMQLENRHLLRVLGNRLMQAGAPELAIPVFIQVRKLGEEEPQSFRDLGLAYAATGQHQEAINQLNEVMLRPWDGRFPEIELITLADLNAIIATAPVALDTSRIDPRLLKNMPLDMRAVLIWDADNTNVDLAITDPNGERAYHSRVTYQGGRLSRNVTGGYGPEEFSLRDAKPGKYKIEVNASGSRQQIVTGDTTAQVHLTTGFGTSSAKTEVITLRLKKSYEAVFVGEFEIKPKGAQ